MGNVRSEPRHPEPNPQPEAQALMAAVMPEREVSFVELWHVFWRYKWITLLVAVPITLATAVYSLMMPEWYRAESLLVPSEERSTPPIAGQLGGLAALAGVSIGGGQAEAVAVLRSRDFVRAFVKDEGLLPLLYQDVSIDEDDRAQSASVPDLRRAVREFRRDILSVQEERATGHVTVRVQWTDAALAASWTNRIVDRLNTHMRRRALAEAEANVAYLQAELRTTELLTLQQSIGRLLETELQKLMLAKGTEEFAFRVIDRAEPPLVRARPRRALMVSVAGVFSVMLSMLVIFLIHAFNSEARAKQE